MAATGDISKFIDVKVEFPRENQGKNQKNIMLWTVDNATTAAYTYQNSQGEFKTWQGWPAHQLTKSKFIFFKRTEEINEIVEEKM